MRHGRSLQGCRYIQLASSLRQFVIKYHCICTCEHDDFYVTLEMRTMLFPDEHRSIILEIRKDKLKSAWKQSKRRKKLKFWTSELISIIKLFALFLAIRHHNFNFCASIVLLRQTDISKVSLICGSSITFSSHTSISVLKRQSASKSLEKLSYLISFNVRELKYQRI